MKQLYLNNMKCIIDLIRQKIDEMIFDEPSYENDDTGEKHYDVHVTYCGISIMITLELTKTIGDDDVIESIYCIDVSKLNFSDNIVITEHEKNELELIEDAIYIELSRYFVTTLISNNSLTNINESMNLLSVVESDLDMLSDYLKINKIDESKIENLADRITSLKIDLEKELKYTNNKISKLLDSTTN